MTSEERHKSAKSNNEIVSRIKITTTRNTIISCARKIGPNSMLSNFGANIAAITDDFKRNDYYFASISAFLRSNGYKIKTIPNGKFALNGPYFVTEISDKKNEKLKNSLPYYAEVVYLAIFLRYGRNTYLTYEASLAIYVIGHVMTYHGSADESAVNALKRAATRLVRKHLELNPDSQQIDFSALITGVEMLQKDPKTNVFKLIGISD